MAGFIYPNDIRHCPYRIFVTGRQIIWRNSPHDRLSCGENLQMADCHMEKYLHKVNVENIYPMGEFCHIRNVDTNQFCHNLRWWFASFFLQFTLFCRKICSDAFYKLLRGKKLKPKTVSVEKKGQIWGMTLSSSRFTFHSRILARTR